MATSPHHLATNLSFQSRVYTHFREIVRATNYCPLRELETSVWMLRVLVEGAVHR